MEEPPIRPDRATIAHAWAQQVLKDDSVTKSIDRPYMEALLVTAAMMEQPMKSLAVAINDNGDHYKVTLKGYKLLMDDAIWYHTFCGPNRDELLDNVKSTATQDVDGIVKVITLSKVKFQTPSTVNSHSTSGSARSRNSGHYQHHQEREEEFVAPSATRRFRKRE